MCFISPPLESIRNKSQDVARQLVVNWRNQITSSNYAFMDSGWKLQRDYFNNENVWVPLNADIAGLCARVDNTNDPWWSPAGVDRGQIKNCISLAFNPDQNSRDLLYQNKNLILI